jgi:hypothetical protein
MGEGTEPDAAPSNSSERKEGIRPRKNAVGARQWLMLGCVVTGLVLAFCVVVGAVAYFVSDMSDGETVAESTPTAVELGDDNQASDDLAVDNEDAEDGADGAEPSDPSAPVDTSIEGGDLDIEFGQVNWFASDIGTFHVFGEFLNRSDVEVEIREILITVRDADGSVLESSRVGRHITTAEPDSMVPFVHMISSELDDFHRIEVEAMAYEWEASEFELFESYQEFEIPQADWREDEWSGSIVGEIANTGEESVEFVVVYAAGYDEDGILTFVETTYVDRDVISSGSNAPFAILYLDEAIDEPAELQVWAEGWVSEE